MGIELKPCPFCGREPAVADIIGGGHAYWVDCYQCETSGPVVAGGNLSDAADAWNRRQSDAATARAEAAEQRAEGLEREVARLRADCAILGDELSEANRLLLSGIPQQRGAKAERAAIACVLTGRAKTLRDRKALGAAEEVEALAFYIEQRGVAAEAQPAGEVSDG